MNDVTVILPIYNLRKRGLKRVFNSVYSLQNQNCDVIVVDGSSKGEYNDMKRLLRGLNVLHFHFPIKEFNKPKLLNKGIELSSTEYIFCSDADYIFKSDLIEVCERYRSSKTLLHKKVKMLPNINITRSRIDKWSFPNCRFNEWGTLANGAMQYSTKKFFIENPYPEEMCGMGGMDNYMAYLAFSKWFAIVWVDDSEIMHQNHPIINKTGGSEGLQFKKNQEFLAKFIKDNNLPPLLTKNG